ncbi:MAG: SH3 domain-containing protein [Candidatus Omnitrophica bacterium]|nr:SH3 domain-containing protein [Candidatus Omnitrophota bacterium]
MKLFLLTLVLGTILIPAAYALTEYIVNEDDINIRSDSTVLSASLGKLYKDDWVTVVSQRYEWSKIILPKDTPAYVWAEYVSRESDSTGKVSANALNIRNLPSLQSDVIGKIYQGDEVEILAEEGEWLKIKAFPNSFGWVHQKFLDKATKTSNFKKEESKPVLKLGEIRKIDEDISLTSFVANIIPRLSNPNIKKKEIYHKELAEKGELIIPLLESYLPTTDENTIYSIIDILSKLGEKNPVLVSYFLKKVEDSKPLLSGVYLDIIQNILQIKKIKIPFYQKAIEKNLLPEEINEAKQKFENAYQDKLIQDIKDSL